MESLPCVKSFLKDISKHLSSTFDKEDLNFCDHICYRVETLERYEQLKVLLNKNGKKLTESTVSKRSISIFALNNPIEFNEKKINHFELPAPKEGSFYKEGWEHLEFVIKDLDSFIKKYSHLDFNTKAMSREINPELGYKFSNSMQVKFHPLPIDEVIRIENELNIKEVN